MLMVGKREVICEHCKHVWNTVSFYKQVTCPSCLLKTRNYRSKVKEEKE